MFLDFEIFELYREYLLLFSLSDILFFCSVSFLLCSQHEHSTSRYTHLYILLYSPPPFYPSPPLLRVIQVVKAIAGEDGVALCRSLLDGIDDDGEGELQSRVTEGRCTGG